MRIIGHSERAVSKCKGPGVRMCLTCLQNRRETCGVEWMRGEHRGNGVQGISTGCVACGNVCVLSRSVMSHSLYVTLWIIACQVPLSMGILQARILEWNALPSSKGSSRPRDQIHIPYVSSIGRQVLYH